MKKTFKVPSEKQPIWKGVSKILKLIYKNRK